MTPLRSIFYSVFVISGTALGAVNGPCSIDGTPGVCISTSSCSGSDGSFRSGFCPNDPSNIKCCIKPECGSGGNCRFSSQCSGSTKTGLCPGPADFQCCLGKSSGGGDTSTSHSLSAHGVTFIEGFEGWNPNFYEDSAGVKTIGYGHACQPASSCNSIEAPISRATGDKLLRQDAAGFVSCVNRYITVALTQNQFDALVSFTYNLGCGNLKELAPNLNSHQFAKATAEMKEYVHAGGKVLEGLVKRRQAEVDLFNS